MLKLYNTLTHEIEEFEPLNPPVVKMYTCGPTVYDFMHIGNLRTFVFSDILFRALKYNNYQIEAVENITDIDDKIIKKAKSEGKTIGEITKEYTKYFLQDIEELNIFPENLKEQPRATDYVEKMIEFIKVLLEKDFAYLEKDGSVYFDISKFPNYGKLSGVEKRELKSGTRILSDEYTKDDVRDFALWKTVGKDEIGYDCPWGKGRPGWHIECSVMSQSILGNRIDIHTGGIDLIFPHHENEIAQSEAKTGESPFVKYWVHGAHMLVDGKKMSKSFHNFYTLSQIVDRGYNPLALRYLFLQTHYRQEMNFTFEALLAAQNALERLRREISAYEKEGEILKEFEGQFLEAVNDDLNMPQALSALWEVVRSDNSSSQKAATVFKFDEVLGLSLKDSKSIVQNEKDVPAEVQKLLKERESLRKEKKFEEADKIREKIIGMGFKVEDPPSGEARKD
jgi:cysteinyl-tRNA synthetase